MLKYKVYRTLSILCLCLGVCLISQAQNLRTLEQKDSLNYFLDVSAHGLFSSMKFNNITARENYDSADEKPLVNIPDSLPMYDEALRKVITPIYALPYSLTNRSYDWHRLWINTAVLSGAFVGTLLVLECLPEDATSWNRAEIRNTPLFKRWYNHVFVKGPEWDHDKFVFNYVLHPYAGAVYFMAARSNGFNFWQSFLYSAIISDIGWEFGIEAFMERPSYQDMIITPVVGSIIGEGFYKIKRYLVEHDYRLFGSPVIGNIIAFLVDPVNEVVGLFDHNPARQEARRRKLERGERIDFSPTVTDNFRGFTLTITF